MLVVGIFVNSVDVLDSLLYMGFRLVFWVAVCVDSW